MTTPSTESRLCAWQGCGRDRADRIHNLKRHGRCQESDEAKEACDYHAFVEPPAEPEERCAWKCSECGTGHNEPFPFVLCLECWNLLHEAPAATPPELTLISALVDGKPMVTLADHRLIVDRLAKEVERLKADVAHWTQLAGDAMERRIAESKRVAVLEAALADAITYIDGEFAEAIKRARAALDGKGGGDK